MCLAIRIVVHLGINELDVKMEFSHSNSYGYVLIEFGLQAYIDCSRLVYRIGLNSRGSQMNM